MGPKVNTNPSRAAIENSSDQRKSAAPIPALAAIPPWLRVERSTTETMKGSVLVQPEVERGRPPLVSIPSFGRGSSRHGVSALQLGL
jgi:hypothetical protein